MKRLFRGLVAAPIVILAVVGGVLLFTAPKAPPPIAAIQSAGDVMSAFAVAQPKAQFITVRDGAKLSYRLYPGKPGRGVVVAVHGSSGNTVAMHGVAREISAKGATVYSIDLRGHGLSKGPDGRLGDVVYRGQYEDDISDVAKFIEAAHPGEQRLLLGHSMGGATILRTASMPAYARNFDGYLALSPFIAPGSAMDRPNEGGWTSVSVPRIVVLSILNQFGISALDHMTVMAMAVPEDDRNNRPHSYSHALLASADLPREWEPALAAIKSPAQILIGADDELFFANAYPSEIKRANPGIKVTLLPKVTHMGIVYQREALEAVAQTALDMLAGPAPAAR